MEVIDLWVNSLKVIRLNLTAFVKSNIPKTINRPYIFSEIIL